MLLAKTFGEPKKLAGLEKVVAKIPPGESVKQATKRLSLDELKAIHPALGNPKNSKMLPRLVRNLDRRSQQLAPERVEQERRIVEKVLGGLAVAGVASGELSMETAGTMGAMVLAAYALTKGKQRALSSTFKAITSGDAETSNAAIYMLYNQLGKQVSEGLE